MCEVGAERPLPWGLGGTGNFLCPKEANPERTPPALSNSIPHLPTPALPETPTGDFTHRTYTASPPHRHTTPRTVDTIVSSVPLIRTEAGLRS